MRKFRAVALCLGGVVVASFAIAWVGLNLYVQSQGTQARIQQELSQRLGTTLRIQRISVTPWAGLKLTGITIPQSQPGVSPDFLKAKSFRLRIRFSSLFGGQLVIKEISLIDPEIVWAQNTDGKWRLPSMPPKPQEPLVPEKPAPTEVPAAPTPAVIASPAAAASPPAEQKVVVQEPPTKPVPPLPVPIELPHCQRFARQHRHRENVAARSVLPPAAGVAAALRFERT